MHLLNQEVHETYEVKGLRKSNALELFCWKALKRPKPTEEFLDLSKKVVNYSVGLPLALKVLGDYLKGRSIEVWGDAIEKIKNFSDSEIFDVLKMHDLLEEMGKQIVIQESPDDTSKRSRLWCYEDIDSEQVNVILSQLYGA
ncbi:hypothetical protein PIB30_045542 [Stylosanthes scabra]|uniref:Uncharacterized protein n=1 Tax=Stylosanthes scabra TaxID=79078 RepID=A0ABU6UEX6_9FABA|nr:hypothetical protein [Stylosanthes scabra]